VAAASAVAGVPLGLSVTSTDLGAHAWRRLWPIAGVIAAVSLCLPRGGLATGMALFFVATGLALAVNARVVVGLGRRPADLGLGLAMLAPAVGAVALLVDRSGPAERLDLLAAVAVANLVGFCATVHVVAVAPSAGAQLLAAAIALGAMIACLSTPWGLLGGGLLVVVGAGAGLRHRGPALAAAVAGLLLMAGGALTLVLDGPAWVPPVLSGLAGLAGAVTALPRRAAESACQAQTAALEPR
jgi:hypothetical protein